MAETMEVTLLQAGKLLLDSDNIVLTPHIHPDGDCLGSMLALYHFLIARGKTVRMVLDDAVPSMYEFLPGTEHIVRPGPSDKTAGLLVIIDASDRERIGQVGLMTEVPVLNIDHHVSNTKFADYIYLDKNAAATGEIILELFRALEAQVTDSIALCLYTAIATDCGFFRYANTTAKTLRYAADLIDLGVKPSKVAENLDTKPLSSILALRQVLDTLEFHYEGKLAAITLFPEVISEENDNTEGFINYPRNIEGVEIAIMFKNLEEGLTRVSLRSKNTDVSKLALAFGGGGHARAAGCTVKGPLAAVKEQVFRAAIDLMREKSE